MAATARLVGADQLHKSSSDDDDDDDEKDKKKDYPDVDGKGVGIAVIDSGVSPRNRDLNDSVVLKK